MITTFWSISISRARCGVQQLSDSEGTNALITFALWLNDSELYESFLCVSFKTAEKMKLSKDASLLCLRVSFKLFDEKEGKLTGDVGLVELVEYKQLELGGLGVLDTPCHCCHPSSNFFVSSSFLSSQLKCLWFLLLKASLFFYWPNWCGIDQKGRWMNSDFPTLAPFNVFPSSEVLFSNFLFSKPLVEYIPF